MTRPLNAREIGEQVRRNRCAGCGAAEGKPCTRLGNDIPLGQSTVGAVHLARIASWLTNDVDLQFDLELTD